MVELRDGPSWLRNDDNDDDDDDNDDSVTFANVRNAKEPTAFSLYSLLILADCFWLYKKKQTNCYIQ